MTAYLARIDLFPIKSLDGVSVPQATVLASGALQGDRTYALVDADQRFIHGKRQAAIHRLRASFSSDLTELTLAHPGQSPGPPLPLEPHSPALEAWFSDYFQQPVSLVANPNTGFPDDTTAAGPTLISTATLATVASWYPHLSVEELRRRFRANLEIDGVPAFWEDQLFGAGPEPVEFTIGPVRLEGVNPCQRCIVPTRDALTGEATAQFQAIFVHQRQRSLPAWSPRSRFNHYYRLAVNTNIRHQGGQHLTVGDGVALAP